MTRRAILNLAAVAPAAGFLSGFACGRKPLRWVRFESWRQHRRSLDTLVLLGLRSDGAVFTVAGMPGIPLRHRLDDYLAYPIERGDAFATGLASGWRA